MFMLYRQTLYIQKHTNRNTSILTDRQTSILTDRQTSILTDRQTSILTDREKICNKHVT